MGRGNRNQSQTANSLLYGSRSRGSGPQIIDPSRSATGFIDFLTNNDQLPAWLKIDFPSAQPVRINRYGIDPKWTSYDITLSGIFQNNGKSQETSLGIVLGGDKPLLYIDETEPFSPVADHLVPGNAGEKKLLSCLAKNFEKGLDVEFALYHPDQLHGLVNNYRDHDLRLTSTDLPSCSEAQIIDIIYDRHPDMTVEDGATLREARNLQELLNKPSGQDILARYLTSSEKLQILASLDKFA